MRLAYPDNKEAISQSLEGVFCCFCFFHISRKPTLSVVLVNLIVWQGRPPPHVEVTRSFLSVKSDLSGLAFSKSMHTHTTKAHVPHVWVEIHSHTSRGWSRGWGLSTQTTPGSRQLAWWVLMWPWAFETLYSLWTRSTPCSVSYSTKVRQTIGSWQPRW